MSPALLLLAQLALPVASASEAAAGEAAPPAPTETQQILYRALTVRDPAPDCTELSLLSQDPVGDLAYIVAHADQPPWAAMRAAGCLLSDHHEAARPLIEGWLQSPEQKGLAILVATQLDSLPEPVALNLARQGLAGPHAASLRSRIARSERAAVRQLAQPARD